MDSEILKANSTEFQDEMKTKTEEIFKRNKVQSKRMNI